MGLGLLRQQQNLKIQMTGQTYQALLPDLEEMTRTGRWDIQNAGATTTRRNLVGYSGTTNTILFDPAGNSWINTGGNVGIGTTAPNASALLDVTSTTQGLLPPRMNTVQRNAITVGTAQVGLVIYNTDLAEMETYDGVANGWEAVGAGAAVAAGTTGQVQFNNGSGDLAADAGLTWDNTGKKLGIGTTAPAQALNVVGNVQIGTGSADSAGRQLSIYGNGSSPPQIIMTSKSGQVLTVGGQSDNAGYISDAYGFNINFDTSNSGWAASNFNIQHNGSSVVTVTASTSNVGIGTVSPAAKLDVYGGIDISGQNGISFPSNDTTATGASLAIGPGTLVGQTGTGVQYQNVAIGYQAIGTSALASAAIWNTAVGSKSLASLISGGGNTAVGKAAGLNTTVGSNNSAFGMKALNANTLGGYNTAIGAFSLGNNANTSTMTGSGNTAVGYSIGGAAGAGGGITSGSNNTLFGSLVASTTLTTGNNNILIGTDASTDTPASGTSNFINLGNAIYATNLYNQTNTGGVAQVGIGTASPVNTLDVTGTGIHIGSGVPGALTYQLYNNAGTLTWNGNAVLTGGSGGGVTGTGSAGYDAIWTSATNIGTGLIYENGTQVGIGTTSPFTTFDVRGVVTAGIPCRRVEAFLCRATIAWVRLLSSERNMRQVVR